MRNLFNVEEKTAIITGGMGQLGSQYARALLENGAKVAIFDVKIDRKNSYLASQVKNIKLKLYKTDITRKQSLKRSLDRVIYDLGIPSILINNAALDVPPGFKDDNSGAFENYPEACWDKTCAVNLKGTFLSCQVIGSFMANNIGGSIVNISSIYGNVSPDQRMYAYLAKKGKPFFKPVSYAVTKAGIINLSRYLATYWANKNIRVNTLTLGGVFNRQDKEFLKEYARRVPLSRMANEDEYNAAIIFLVSDASSYMTGSNMIIDGGFTAW